MDENKKPALYRLICLLVGLCSPRYHLAGTENLPGEPCVIVGNHCQMYGPIAGELHMPGKPYIWCAAEMMHRKQVPSYAFQDFWSGKPKSIRWFYRLLSHLIAPLSEYIFTNARTVPVYHDAQVIVTFRESIALLKKGRSLVVFPEHYTEHNNIIHEFQDRFVDLARLYYRSTGRPLRFVPLYLAPRLKTMFFGEPVSFRPDAPLAEERRRICGALMDAVTRIAAAQPEHTVIPYPNIPKRQYPKNIPLEDYTHAAKAL